MNDKFNVVTNNMPRNVIYGFELSEKERQEFDYMENVDDGTFFKYKGNVYDLREFMRVSDVMQNCHNLAGWDGYQYDSFFSGVLIKYVDDCERVIVGRFYS